MKKRFISLILALCLMCGCVLPAYAADVSGIEPRTSIDLVVTPEDVQAIYDAYIALDAALETSSFEKVEDALEDFNNLLDKINAMEEAELVQLGELMGCDIEGAFSNILDVAISAGVLELVNELYKTFSDTNSAGDALLFIEYYDAIFNDPENDDESLKQLVRDFFPDIDDYYSQAKDALPDDDIMDAYYAVEELASALYSDSIETLREAMSSFDEQKDFLDSMSDSDREIMAELFGIDSSDVSELILTAETYADLLDTLYTTRDALSDSSSVENAEAFIEAYDEIFSNPEYEELQGLVLNIVPDATDSSYEYAERIIYLSGFKRLSGNNRVETAIAISFAGFSRNETENVIIASGDDFADALAGVPLAYALNAPILLVRNHVLTLDNLSNMHYIGAKNVYILGGEFAINTKVENKLIDEGYNVTRIAGEDRFGTSLEIAKELQKICGKPEEIFFVYSHNYPDALSVSSAAALKNSPILYVGADGVLKKDIASFVKASKADKGTIISGPAVISSKAESSIKKAGVNDVNRIYGINRYETCVEINNAYNDLFVGDAVCVATGYNYPDALAGGVFAAKKKAPIFLADGPLSQGQQDYLTEKAADEVYVFGGTGVITDALAVKIAEY